MSLNLYEILQKVLNESVSSDNINKAIDNHNYVEITYVDDEGRAIGPRLIQPYAYGISSAGNEVLRAFQNSGSTYRGVPKWKYFRLDRITSWKPRKQTFNVPPPMQGYDTQDYNALGDESMMTVIHQAKFSNDSFSNDLTSLNKEREKTEYIANAPKIRKGATSGPIPYANQQYKNNVYTSRPNSKKYAQYAKNIADTENDMNRFDDDIWARAEAEKRQQDDEKMKRTAIKPTQAKQGPLGNPNKDEKDFNNDGLQ